MSANLRIFGIGVAAFFAAWLAVIAPARSEPALIGQTGLVQMPDARIGPDGTWRFGVSDSEPYSAFWSSVSVLPWVEVSGRYTKISNVPAFPDQADSADYRDKAFDAKIRLFRESRYTPALSIGVQDYLGTELFAAQYVALSKRIGAVDFTLGYGEDRIDGLFGGLRYCPAWAPDFSFVAEYDANDYSNDHQADLSGADERDGGLSYGLEYKYGWLGAQLSFQQGKVGLNAYVSIPLMEKEFVPKVDEPAPYMTSRHQPGLDEWRSDPTYGTVLVDELHRDGFENIHLALRGHMLEATLTHVRISDPARAIARAARILSLIGPHDAESIRIIYTVNDLPVLSYDYGNTGLLRDYIAGRIAKPQLDASVVITAPEMQQMPAKIAGQDGIDGAEEGLFSKLYFSPFNVRFLFNITRNDPGQPLHYDTFSYLGWKYRLGEELYFDASARLTLFEDVSDVAGISNSLLPHVRSDIADYRRGQRFNLNSLLLNRYFSPRTRVYGRVSSGYYEEMFAGAGGQMLYLAPDGRWAADITVDWLWQRAPGEPWRVTDYSVLTALGALHYRWSRYDLTSTLRAGRFLAGDEGARYELKRRFRSGVEIGAWYTVTNGHDITSPGSPDSPYRDKGVFVSIPLSSMLTRDTQERASMALSPWTRDVGQMVVSPGDLYELIDSPTRSYAGQENSGLQ